MKQRTYQTHLRLTESEREAVRKLAARENRTVANWLQDRIRKTIEREVNTNMKKQEFDGFTITISEKTGEKFYTDDTFTLAYVDEENEDFSIDDSRRYIRSETDLDILLEHFSRSELRASRHPDLEDE